MQLRTSATTAGGTPKSWSSGGRPSNSQPSSNLNGFWDAIGQTQNDNGYTDYRCLFVYNTLGFTIQNVQVSLGNRGGGANVSVALSSVATNTFANYQTAVIANEGTAPSITGAYGSTVTIGTLTAGQVKAVWLKREVNRGEGGTDDCTVLVSGRAVIPTN